MKILSIVIIVGALALGAFLVKTEMNFLLGVVIILSGLGYTGCFLSWLHDKK